MYIALTHKEIKKINEIEAITGTETELINGELIETSDLIGLLFDLLCEYNHKEEEISDLQYEIDNNYELKRINLYEEYGVSERDFY